MKNDPIRDSKRSLDSDYELWINEHEPNPTDLLLQRETALKLGLRPLLSVIVPIFNPKPWMLETCLESVLAQTYDRWELCIAIAPTCENPKNIELVYSLSQKDVRVRLVELQENLGISGNSNAALGIALGDFVVLLDHDDVLPPFALFEVAKQLETDANIDILYSDHDYLDSDNGLRCNPLLKPDWSPEIMFSANYLSHLTVLRRKLVEEVGRFDPRTDGAQDWDLFLRLSESTMRIAHIPKILYHWRMHSESTARNDAAKDYVSKAQLLTIRGHLERIGLKAEPEIMDNGLLHVRFQEQDFGKVSIIIPTKDRVDLLSRCISTLLEKTSYKNFEVLIVDTGSFKAETRQYLEQISNDERIRIKRYPGKFNYSAVNNIAAGETSGDFLLFLNNDVEITSGSWLTELVCWATYQPIGVVGGRLLRASGVIQHAGVVVGLGGFADHPFADQPPLTYGIAGSTGWYRNYLAVTGACMLMRRQVFDEIRGFDDSFVLCGSDVELCLRAYRHGYRILYNPFAELIHHERQTRSSEIPDVDFVQSSIHYKQWLLDGDPYWNVGLSLWSRQPAFRRRGEQSSMEFVDRYVKDLSSKQSGDHSRPAQEWVRNDEDMLATWFDCSASEFLILQQWANFSSFHRVKRILWLIPEFENAFYGGIYTILSFAAYWKREKQVDSLFAICGGGDADKMAQEIRQIYPAISRDDVFILRTMEEAANLPSVDASICTLWTTAYYAAKHKAVLRRFYFIQDFEPSFYRAGSASALVESTYRMGLWGITNTISLKKMYEEEYGGKAVHFDPCVNASVFHPATTRSFSSDGPWQIFFYGRPNHPRNAFELARRAMQELKVRMGDRIRIVCAGSEWEPSDHGLGGVVDNLGTLAYEDSARLYRECDIGVVLMLTRHPSYIPYELMASECLTVTNRNAWTSWLLKDGQNCLLTYATASAIADTVERALLSPELRKKIVKSALETIRSTYIDWPLQMEKVYEFMCNPSGETPQLDQRVLHAVASA